jgi:poly(3-hydroxybutyrate) depolymerase
LAEPSLTVPAERRAPGARRWVLQALLVTLLALLARSGATSAQEPGLSLSGLSLRVPSQVAVDEEQALQVSVTVVGGGATPRVFVEGLPPGATWDEPSRTLTFRPDFIQGGASYPVEFLASGGGLSARARVTIEVRDTVRPPPPRVRAQKRFPGSLRLELEQPTDRWLDSPGHAGRTFPAVVTVPRAASAKARLPVVVRLHGVGGWPTPARDVTDRFLIEPSDPHLTYWWGYSERLPAGPPEDGSVPAYTQRRVLALLEWVLRHHPGADPERVFVEGDSMGASGALMLGLLRARHFAGVHASHGQTVMRGHRPSRLAQLATVWGAPEKDLATDGALGVWSRLDLTRALRDEPEARTQHVTVVHGKDDPVIHFGAAVGRGTLTGASFYEALQAARVGHYAAWDEGGHLTADPWLGARWWARDWNPQGDTRTFLRRDLAFPAFSRSTWDGRPGEGSGNGRRPWHAESGFAGSDKVAGDTGWDGDVTGTLNGGLRWDARRLVDTPQRFELPLRAARGPGDLGLPVVDVTPRRVQRFQCLPGERLRWTFGPDTGSVTASPDGSVTVPALRLRETWTALVLEREQS